MSNPSTTATAGPMQQPATWDTVAPGYADVAVAWFHGVAREAAGSMPLEPSDRVVDVAAGPGTLTFAIAPRVAHVSAVDFSAGMIEQLRARAAREGVRNVDGAVMDAHALALADASFDAAFCMFGFMFFPDRPRAFAELRRVLRPGGHLMVATWATIDRRPLMKVGFDAIAEVLPDLPRPQKGDLQQTEECVQEVSAAGFAEVTARRFTVSVPVGSAEQYLEVTERSGAPLAMLRKRLGPEAWPGIRARLLEAIARRLPADGSELTAEAILTTATR